MIQVSRRDFAAELQAARAAEDWASHERLWEERRSAEVAADEQALKDEDAARRDYFEGQNSPELRAMERAGDFGPAPYSPEAYDEMVRQDAEGRS